MAPSSTRPTAVTTDDGDFVVASQRLLARAVGAKLRTVESWLKAGMPCRVADGYSVPRAVEWLLKRGGRQPGKKLDETEAESQWREKNVEFQAKLKEAAFRQTMGDLVDKSEVEAGWAKRVQVVRQGHRNLAVALPPELVGRTESEIQELLREAFDRLCEDYADGGLEVEPEVRSGRGRPRRQA